MYRRDQWTRLLDVSVDRDDLEPSYEEWWQNTAEKLYSLSRVGLCPIEVDIDVEELLGWCNAQNCPVDAKARAQYAVERVRQQRVLDAQRRARWLETGAYDVVKDLYSEGIYNPVARAYFADRFDGSIAQLIEIADGRISARNIGPKRRKVLRDAIEQRNATADPESG